VTEETAKAIIEQFRKAATGTTRRGRTRKKRYTSDPEKIRLFQAFVITATPWECQIWPGNLAPAGYGTIWFSGRLQAAHRLVYEAAHGPIAPGLVLDHWITNIQGEPIEDLDGNFFTITCERACCNHWHLEPVTQGANVLRGHGLTAQLARQTHCRRGHLFDAVNTYNGQRECRICRRRRNIRNYHKRRNAPWL
jgi:hypothetical protein